MENLFVEGRFVQVQKQTVSVDQRIGSAPACHGALHVHALQSARIGVQFSRQ